MTKFSLILRIVWAISFIAPFFIFKWWAALLLIVLIFLSPGAFIAIGLTKSHSKRLGMVWTELLNGLIEGGFFALILGALDVFTRLSISPIESLSMGAWLFTINQLNRAARTPDTAKEESLLIPGFIFGAFLGFCIWMLLYGSLA